MVHILFVCHGNICRSTMAEFVMKDLVKKAGRATDYTIASAACRRDALGADTHSGTKRKLKEMGIAYTPRRAVQIRREDYEIYDHILAMDEENVRDLRLLTDGDPKGKIRLLLSLCGEEREVADPWYTGNFDATYRDVARGCRALFEKIDSKK